MFVALVCFCLLLNSVAVVYVLTRTNLDPRGKKLFTAAAFGSLALQLILATQGHNYDMESWGIVASLVLHGKSVYANTTRFNYGPIWAYILAGLEQLSASLPAMGGEAFHVTVAAFLGLADMALAALLAAQYGLGAGLFLLCCPATILLTGYHSQFEDFALLAGLASWLLIRRGGVPPLRLALAAGLLGISLVIKHILFLFPVWVLFWPKLGSWRKRVAYVVIAYGIFALSFLPWIVDPPSRAGIYHQVFQYRSYFGFSLSRLIVSVDPMNRTSPAASAVLTLGWLAVLVAAGVVLPRRLDNIFPMYLLTMFAFSPALTDQYLAVPLLAGAILVASWPSWALAGAIVLALYSSPYDVFRFHPNLVYYLSMVSTQICAMGLLVVQLRHASPPWTTPIPHQETTRRAVTLAFGSLALVLVILLVKSLAQH